MTDSGSATGSDSLRTPPPVVKGAGNLPSPGFSVTGLSDSAIIFSDFRSPVDLLGSSGGVFIIESGEGGFDRIQSVHGLRPGSLAFLSDGLLLNDPATGLFSAGMYPVGFAELMEIATPSSGSLYALNGVGGAVNFVSREMRAVRPLSGIRYSQSSYGYSLLDGDLTQDVSRGLNVTVGITRSSYDGRFLNSAVDGWKGRAKVRYDLEGASVYVCDLFTRSERGLNDGISDATPDTLLYDRIRAQVVNESATETIVRHDLRAGIAFGPPDGTGNLTIFDLQLGTQTRRYIDEAAGTGSTGTPFRDTRREQSTAFRFVHSRRVGQQTLSGGVEVRNRHLLEDTRIGSHRTTQASAFARLNLTPLPALTVTPGARLDRTMDLTRFSGGVDAVYRPAPPFLIRGSVSRSHRFPSFLEAFGIAQAALPLPGADAERHDLLSVGFTVGDSSGTFLSADLFHRRVTNPIGLDSAAGAGTPGLEFLMAPEESRIGVSASANVVAGSIVAELNADYLSYGGTVTRRYAPEWSLGGGVYFRDRLVGGHLDLKAGFRGRYFTSYDGGRLSRQFGTYIPSNTEVPPAGTLDFVLVAGIGDAYLHFIWENLLDREYFMEVLYPVNDRSVRFGVTWSFLD